MCFVKQDGFSDLCYKTSWVIRSPTTLILEKKNEPIPKGTCRWITPGVTFQLSTSTVCISTSQPIEFSSFLSKVCCYGVWLTHWLWETKCHLKSSAKNMQSNRWPFKSQVFHTVHWALKFWSKSSYTSHMRLLPEYFWLVKGFILY
jgi:hypothetical protein